MPAPRPLLQRIRSGALSVAKRAASDAATYSGMYRMAASRYGGLGVIFTVHRVVEPGRPILWPGFEIEADVLESIVARTRRLGWEAISLDELHRRLSGAGGGARFVCFTFDDGYVDTLRLALPIFQRHATPLGLFATTGLVDRSAFYWWGALEELVLANERIEWVDSPGAGPRVLAASTLSEKCTAYAVLGRWGDRAEPAAVRDLLRRYAIDWEALVDRDFLTSEQTRALAADPLVTIGAHGLTHRRLAEMPEEEMLRELDDGRRILEGWTGKAVRHLAYPFGSPNACGPREFALATKLGYATGMTTRRGNLFPEHGDSLTALPRREIPTSLVALRNALSGAVTVLRGAHNGHSA